MGSSENPVPLWGTVMIGIAGGFFFLCCLIILCKNSCCKKKEKYESSRGVGYADLTSQDFSDSKVQPDLEELALFKKDNYGRLHIALEYDKHVEELEVTIIQATNLRGTGQLLGSIINPYIRVYISPDFNPIYDTNVIHLTSNPVFNQKFVFKLPYSSHHSKSLVFCIYHDVLLSKPDKLGQIRLQLGSYDLAQRYEEWHEIGKPEPDEKDTNLGDICLSLRYVPTPGRLTVVVLEAKGLKEIPKEPKEYFVKLSLVLKKKTLRKRRTTSKQSTSNPYYNESFIFDTDMETMQRAYLKVTAAIPRGFSIAGRSIPVGYVELGLGSRASENAKKHWNEVLKNIGRPIVHWQSLLPVSDE